MKRTHLDLFSGIGGFAIAAQRCGLETIGFSEIDAYASAVLKKHWPHVKNYGDIRNVPPVGCWLITGGDPCQPFSNAGNQRGKDDDRYLWPAKFRIIKMSRPTWYVGENVASLVEMEFDNRYSDLESIGYQVQSFIIPACGVGASHRRNRAWIIAHAESKCGGAGHGETGQIEDWNKPSNIRKDVSYAPGVRLQGQRAGRQQIPQTHESKKILVRGGGDFCEWPTEPAVGRVAHGIPERSHRLKGLGNSIVPQVAEEIIRFMILADGN